MHQTMILQLIMAFTGALGYAMLFKVEKGKLLKVSFGGFLAWACYLLCQAFFSSQVGSYFTASVVITAYAELMARKDKTPAMVYLVPATIPLIPGGFLYRTMSYALAEEWSAFFATGLMTLLLAVAISGGILTAMSVIKIVSGWKMDRERRRRYTKS